MDQSAETLPEATLEPAAPAHSARRKRIFRIAAAALLLAGLFLVGRASGLTDELSPEKIRQVVESAGAWGYIVYVVVFVLLELVQVPGWMLIAAGALAYGKALGFVVAMCGAIASIVISFLLVRWVGGQPLGEIKNRWARKILDKLDERPVMVIFLLRLILWVSPPITYALALTRVRFRDYFIGSALGLIVPVLLLTLFFDWLVQYLPG